MCWSKSSEQRICRLLGIRAVQPSSLEAVQLSSSPLESSKALGKMNHPLAQNPSSLATGDFVFLLGCQTAGVVLVHLSRHRSFDLNSNQQTHEGEMQWRGALTWGQEGPSASLHTLDYAGVGDNSFCFCPKMLVFNQGMNPLSIMQMSQRIFIFLFNPWSVLEVMTGVECSPMRVPPH